MADYGNSDTSTTSLGTNQFPISEAWTPNAGFSAVEGGPQSTDSGGKKSAPASMYVKDGSDVTQGLTTDAAVTGDNAGTLSAKLRGISKIWNDIWDSVNHRIKVDGSGVTQPVSGSVSVSNFPGTQPVSGTVTANAGTNLNTSLLALESGGNLASAKTDLDNVSTVSGATTDVAVVGDNAGSLSAKLRGLTKIFNDVWDSVNHRIHVNVDNGNANGQSTMVNSSPVVIASDQTAVQVKRSAVAVYSATQTAQGTGNSGDLTVGPYTELSIDINITANVQGTNPTLQFEYDRKGADGIYYPVWFSDLINGLPANPTKVSVSLGAGMQWPESLGTTGRILWTVGGTATPQYTFSVNAIGK